MRRTIIKIISFIVVFIVAVIVISTIMNQGNSDMTTEMSEATLPMVYTVHNGERMNPMHGYVDTMDIQYVKDHVTPLSTDRKINFVVDDFNTKINKISYEVRNVAGDRLIENNEVAPKDGKNGLHMVDLQLKDLIVLNEEYQFIVLLELEDGREVNYYTRIMMLEENHLSEKIDYILDFHNKTFMRGSDESKELIKYLESNKDGDNSTFHKVNIHSSFSQVMWGNLNIKKESEPIPRIKENSPSTATIELNYQVSVLQDEEMSYFNVKELYRVRYTVDRMYLLEYERTMGEILLYETESFTNDKLVIGIADDNIGLIESEGGNVYAFVNEGRLYTYNIVENKLTRLFSFYDEENMDCRTLYKNHEIKILDLEENGNVTFLVYGYMNRGNHEGKVGVQVYYYSAPTNSIEEQLFIPQAKSAEIVIHDVNRLSYYNKNNHIFLLLDSCIYDIEVMNHKYEVIYNNVKEGSIQISDDNSMVVWQKEELWYQNQHMIWMNLNTSKLLEMSVEPNENMLPFGFMNEDLIYGVANSEDVKEDLDGNIIFPITKIIVQNEQGKILKEYQKEDVYVMDCKIEENQITLTRAVRDENDHYQNINDEHITNNYEVVNGVNKVVTVVTENMGKIVQIQMESKMDVEGLKVMVPKEVLYEGGRNLTLENQSKVNRYYVYDMYGLNRTTTEANLAVQIAYEKSGSVMDEDGNYIWKVGTVHEINQIMALDKSVFDKEKDIRSVCLNAMLNHSGVGTDVENKVLAGYDSYQILQEEFSKNIEVLNLLGCELKSMLFYIDQDIPVFGKKDNGDYILIIGYNLQNVVLLDPAMDKIYKMGLNDATEMFALAGNEFITYIRK